MKIPTAGNLSSALEAISKSDVLVGITQATTQRKKGKINNASLMYVLSNGSPARGIPATPIIEPAIVADGNKQVITNELKIAAQETLQGHPQQAIDALRRAGVAGRDASKAWFRDPRNNWPPNKPSTIRRKGSDRRNIDIGDLRKQITYVVRQHLNEEKTTIPEEIAAAAVDVIEEIIE